MKTKRSAVLYLSFLLIVVFTTQQLAIASAKRRSDRRAEQSMRIRTDKPTIYISFERAGKREPLRNGESAEGVWLRLHNNTRWAIKIDMNDVPSKEHGDAILFYEVVSDSKTVVDMRCHVCSVSNLSAGESVLFSLPREYLEPDMAIRISFNYEWEADKRGSTSLEPRHYVYFYSWGLPKTLGSFDARPR